MRRIKIVTLMVENGMQFYNEFGEARCRSIDSWDSCSHTILATIHGEEETGKYVNKTVLLIVVTQPGVLPYVQRPKELFDQDGGLEVLGPQ